jgi:hypothetical protein
VVGCKLVQVYDAIVYVYFQNNTLAAAKNTFSTEWANFTLNPGTYTVFAEKNERRSENETVTLAVNDDKTITLNLCPPAVPGPLVPPGAVGGEGELPQVPLLTLLAAVVSETWWLPLSTAAFIAAFVLFRKRRKKLE